VVKIQIQELCEITGKARWEIEAMLKNDEVIELNLNER